MTRVPFSLPPRIYGDPPNAGSDRIIIACLMLGASILVLPNLGDSCLWQDEAQTAVVAKNILMSGLPAASDGKNLVSIFEDHRDVRNGIFIWQGWFPIYLSALSMAVLDADSFGARFPFALSFIILIGISYSIFKRWYPSSQRALLATALMCGCVPLLLHARQCRYYLLAPLLTLLIVNSLLHLLRRPKPVHAVSLTLWMTLLFNSFFPAAALIAFGLVIFLIIKPPTVAAIKLLAIAALVFVLVNLPTIIYCRMWDRQFGIQPGYSNFGVFTMYFLRYLMTLNNFFFPLLLVLAGGLLRWKHLINKKLLYDDFHLISLIICVTQVIGFSLLSDYTFTRYLVGMVPFLMFLAAGLLHGLAFGRNWISWVFVLAVVGTNMIHVLPNKFLKYTDLVKSQWTTAGINGNFLDPNNVGASYAKGEIKELIDIELHNPILTYARSILDVPMGPIDQIVEYLKENARPTDRVKISYGDIPLMFHTNLEIVSALEIGEPGPDWMIHRYFSRMYVDKEFLRSNRKFGYETIELPVPDIQWNNRPDPLYHLFRTPDDDLAPKVKLMKKR